MGKVWDGIVDGAFKGGKWGLIAGAVAGSAAGLFSDPTKYAEMALGYFGPFGAAITYGLAGAGIALLAGIAIGAVAGAVYGAMKDSPEPKTPDKSPQQEAGREPRRGQEQAVSTQQDQAPTTAYRDMIARQRQARPPEPQDKSSSYPYSGR